MQRRRKPKYSKPRENVAAILRMNQQFKTIELITHCPHCHIQQIIQVDHSSKPCATRECLHCKERMFTYLEPKDEETGRCLQILNSVKQLNKIEKALRWFNPEYNFRAKQKGNTQ